MGWIDFGRFPSRDVEVQRQDQCPAILASGSLAVAMFGDDILWLMTRVCPFILSENLISSKGAIDRRMPWNRRWMPSMHRAELRFVEIAGSVARGEVKLLLWESFFRLVWSKSKRCK